MAEAAVELLVVSITYLLNRPGFLIGGVRQEISKIKLELESMRCFIKDAEKCKNEIEGVCVWAVQVRDIVFEAEDVIDEFLYHVDGMKKSGFKAFLLRMLKLPEELWITHKTAVELKKIKGEITDIAKRSKRYDLSHIVSSSEPSSHSRSHAQNISDSAFFIGSDEIVGLDSETNELLTWLEGEEEHRIVISVVGMGGSGKTTLVSKTYTSRTIKRNFNCCAWVSVSRHYTIEDLLRRMITEFFNDKDEPVPKKMNFMDYKHLVETLVKFLEQKRYVVVLDDVWNINFWRQVCVALPDNKNRSRVIITTRKEDIASYPYGAGCRVFHSQPLSKSDAWALFCRKAFCNEHNCNCPEELEGIGHTLVEKCEGLPLAIVALGGLMGSKDPSERKWREVYNALSWHISNNPLLDEVKTIFLLSFNDLPYYLKNCFLYCCIFPMGRWVGAGRLMRMWMAEGFLEEKRGLIPEEVGKIYLKELISRSLLQVTKRHSYLRPKMCKLHDLMWELAHSLSEQENFLSICDPENLEGEIRARRLSVHASDGTFRMGGDMKNVRSFSAFDVKETLDDLLPRFRLLRVLELPDAQIQHLPDVIGNLFNLRYLGLSGTHIKELPKSVGRLRNLYTLDIRRTNVKALPQEIDKLFYLRHLLLYQEIEKECFTYTKGMRVPATICKIKNLQVVNCIEANADIIKGIGKMSQLVRIGLTNVRETDKKALCASIEKLKFLRQILLMVAEENESLPIDHLSSTPPNFRKLTLVGKLKDVPHWFPSLRNIIHLHLHWSRLTEDPVPYLCELQCLEHLTLVNAYSSGKEQLFFSSGFLKLEDLHLAVFPDLVEIVFSNGVMPRLECLNIHSCPKLNKVPQGIEYLTRLEELDLKGVSGEFIQRIGGDGIDRPKIRHIPSIKYRTETESCHL
nr:disease resistance protein RPM1-like [Ipomoea trifida]